MAELIVDRVDVWVAGIQDEPGGLAKALVGLRDAGADLDFIIARRESGAPGSGVVFVTPLRGDREIEAGTTLGFNVTRSGYSLRVEGDNRPGVAAELTEKLASAGINLRGLSAAVIGARFIFYISFDTADDAEKAVRLLEQS
jgi:hypothetical protein